MRTSELALKVGVACVASGVVCNLAGAVVDESLAKRSRAVDQYFVTSRVVALSTRGFVGGRGDIREFVCLLSLFMFLILHAVVPILCLRWWLGTVVATVG